LTSLHDDDIVVGTEVSHREETLMARSRVPADLRERLGENATLALTELLESEQAKWSEHVVNAASERFERHVAEQVGALRTEVHHQVASLRTEMHQQAAALRVEFHQGLAGIRQEMAAQRTDLFKWSFLFWIGQVAVMIFLLRGR
jgi:hypothetical protein